jgi:hypothetical protein
MTQLVKASDKLSVALGMDRDAMLATFKAQCFRNASAVSDAQLAAFVSIAHDMGVNPLLPGMLYAYPTSGGGIVPMMGPAGIYKKLMEHPDVDSWETTVFPEDPTQEPTHAVAQIFRKSSDRPIKYTALLKEWRVSANPNWGSRPRHMLGLRALKKAAEQVIHGLPYDEDDKVIGDLVNVTGTADAPTAAPVAPTRPPAPERSKRGAAAAREEKAAAIEAEVVPFPSAAKAEPPPVEKAEEPKKPEPAPTAPKADSEKLAPAKQPAAEKPATLTALADGQRVTVLCDVQSFTAKAMTVDGVPKPTIAAELTGGFAGKVYHIDGGHFNSPGNADSAAGITADPLWQLEKPVKVTLLGKKTKNGAVAVLVEKLEAGDEAADLALE